MERIKGTVTIFPSEKVVFENSCKELNIYCNEISCSRLDSLRYEIEAPFVMDILTLGEKIGIYSMSEKIKTTLTN